MRVEALFRFPVKGLPGESISHAPVDVGGGILGDRTVAFSNGTSVIVEGAWNSCMNFTILKNNKSLQKWSVRSLPPLITMCAPAETQALPLTFDVTDASDRALAQSYLARYLPTQGTNPRQLVSAPKGMFDSRRAGLSLINPRTVAALGVAAGVDLDPRRYRGNILLGDLPAFAEFGLIGKVLRIGDARIAITKSIERCSATSVNPVTTEVDVNGPRLLATHLGHLHCGIYGTILEAGTIRTDDKIIIEDDETPARSLVQAQRTPRFMQVLENRSVGSDSVELTLRDPLGWITEHDEAGTHLRVHLPDPLWRNYTITSVHDDVLRIAVRAQGVVSARLAKLTVGDELLASGPHGTMTADRVLQGKVALLTAGIGITPSLGLLREADATDGLTELRLIHVARGHEGELVTRLRSRLQQVSVDSTLTYFDSSQARPSVDQLSELIVGCENIMICGPAGFADHVLEACQRVGIPAERIHREIFASPLSDMSELVSKYPDVQITCNSTSQSFTWQAQDGVLLEALESQGLNPSSSCRAGSCGECALTLRRGSVDYLVDPSARVPEGQILACMAVPTDDLVLEI